MKQLLSFILPFVFLYNVGGYFLWFKMEQSHIQSEIRNEIQNGLNKDFLTVINVSAKDISAIEWIDNGKEFLYHGEMYDVVNIRSDKKTIQYECINDKNEEQLITDFCKKDNTHRKTENNVAKYFTQLFYSENSEKVWWDVTKEKPIPCFLLAYSSACKEILNPPPESFC
jgi:hypothetical protein